MSKTKILSIQIGIVIAFGLIWEICGRSSASVFFLVGTPSAVVIELIKLIAVDHLWLDFTVTGGEATIGLLVGTVLGSAIGLALWFSEIVARIARPFILALGTLPIFAFAPLMIVWFGVGFQMKVALAALSTIFVAFTQGYKGASSVAHEHIDALRGMNASRRQLFVKIIIPGSLDWVLNSMRLNVGFGLLGALIGEFIAADSGLGYLIIRASGLYNVPRALAAAFGITLLALTLDAAARYIEGHRHYLVQLLSVPRELWRS